MLRHNIEIVALRVQWRDTQFLTLLPIIAMVVVGAEYCHILNAKNLRDASTQRRLTCSTVSHYSQDDRTPGPYNDRTLNLYRWYSHKLLQTPSAARPWLVTRCEYHLFWYAQLNVIVTIKLAIHHLRWLPIDVASRKLMRLVPQKSQTICMGWPIHMIR